MGFERIRDLISFHKTSSSLENSPNLSTNKTVSTSVDSFICDVCEISCSGVIPFMQHMSSTKHTKVIEKKKLWEEFTKNKQNSCQSKSTDHLKAVKQMPQLTDNKNSLVMLQTTNDETPEKPYTQIHTSQENLNNSFSENVFTCPVCEINCTGFIPYKQHLHSQKHAKMLQRQKIFQNLSADCQDKMQTDEEKPLGRFCDIEHSSDSSNGISDLTFNSQESDSNSNETLLSNVLICVICKSSFSGLIPYDQHMKSNRHKKNVQRNELLQRIQGTHNSNVLSLEQQNSNLESRINICRNIEVNGSDIIMESGRDKEENSNRQYKALSERSDSESIVVITEDDIELGCSVCGICGFLDERAQTEHFETKEHQSAVLRENSLDYQ